MQEKSRVSVGCAGVGAGRLTIRDRCKTPVSFRRYQGSIASIGSSESTKESSMADLIAVTFDDETTAFDLRAELAKLQKEYLIDMDDVVVVTRDEKGKVKLHQAVNLTAAGAVGGSFWGLLIGMLFLNPLLGMAVGAGAGALSGKLTDIGIDDKFMKELGENLPKGGSALFTLVKRSTPDKVIERLEPFRGKGKVMRTSLSKESEDEMRAFLEDLHSQAAG
jgi:uncharacterized membrane protein